MGGCRCTFRTCENSTASKPGMHFFHFPIRDWPRLETWANYAEKPEFKELPMAKLKNKVVCQEHFHSRMFMNYLRESLTKSAVPTLEPLNDGQVLDLETNEIGLREEWIEIQEDSLTSGQKEQDAMLVPVSEDNSRMEIKFVKNDNSPKASRPVHPVILNAVPVSAENTPAKSTPTTTFLRRVVVKRKKGVIQETPSQVKILKIQKLESPTASKSVSILKDTDSVPQPQQEECIDVEDHQPTVCVIPTSSTDIGPEVSAPAPATVVQIQEVPTPFSDPIYLEKVDRNTAQIEDLKKLLTDVLNRPVPSPKVIKVPVPTLVPAPSTPSAGDCCDPKVAEKGPHMNKVQLFNGIKRYLNPMMVALLRMEMFGGSSARQWKPDEKTFSVELMELGENVYDHFTDEFRFRLPGKSDVKKWKEQELDDDDAS
ncbi:uncharacterized protein LOC129746370 [Uranotaenia lowii]|uniref:uncharacterized protein LOC129746370 n=1 Tax=Uranotaenia lowii TaxID=190385 RepID=UPI0024798087|nr:uncharacterized protein LOC129746370 [Uranotaenia lowii]